MAQQVNVPDVDGVPSVNFAPGAGGDIILAAADTARLGPSYGGGAPWGIYSGGRPVVRADTVAAFDYKQDWVISDHPLERGAFESYNKVQVPFDIRVVYTAGGSEANRAALLRSIEAIAGTLNLYEVVTPEAVYPSVNVVHYDYRRTALNGVGLLVVSVWCLEVRVTVRDSSGGSFTSPAAPSGAEQINGGTVQPTQPVQPAVPTPIPGTTIGAPPPAETAFA